ncbi:MAG: nitroreductase family protein [Bacillota bacterium]|jgi:predicted oxidoreductase (fatty acid repression mutant protein)
MDQTLLSVVKDRRSFYAIGKDRVLSDEKIVAIIRHAVQYAPSAFNSQSARVLVLLGKEHDRLWTFIKDILKGIVPPEQFLPTEKKINAFQNGYGTVLYFEDQDTVSDLQRKYPLYQQNFPIWSIQSSGMLQYSIWMLLEEAGFGASLQHYNPLIDEKVKSTWNLPKTWELLAEMPFGKPLAAPDAKIFLPLDDRIKVFQ